MLQVLTKNTSNFKGYLCRRSARGGQNPDQAKPQGLDEEELKDYQILHCAACGHAISYVEASCERDGSHEHLQVNPHGVTFVFGCFTTAPGVVVISRPETEFSWFHGYGWQIVVCENCQIHLGWVFTSTQDEFFGLLLNMLQG